MDSELEVGKGGGAGEKESLGIPQGGTERTRGLARVIDGALGTDTFSAAHPPLLPPVPCVFSWGRHCKKAKWFAQRRSSPAWCLLPSTPPGACNCGLLGSPNHVPFSPKRETRIYQ